MVALDKTRRPERNKKGHKPRQRSKQKALCWRGRTTISSRKLERKKLLSPVLKSLEPCQGRTSFQNRGQNSTMERNLLDYKKGCSPLVNRRLYCTASFFFFSPIRILFKEEYISDGLTREYGTGEERGGKRRKKGPRRGHC